MSADNDSHTDKVSQVERFKKAARELEADEDEGHWDDRLRKIAKVKPKPDKPQT